MNIATAGIGNKTKRAIVIRNLLDFGIRVLSDVAFGGESIMWAAATNLMSMGSSGILLAKYGRKIFDGECIGRFGGCFVPGTQVVVGSTDQDVTFGNDSITASIAIERTTTTKAIESLSLGSRVLSEAPEHLPRDTQFGEPDPLTWRQITLLQSRGDGANIEMELMRPLWWIRLFQLSVGMEFSFDIPELHTIGSAKVLGISPCPPIEHREGQVIIGKFVTRQASNLMTVSLTNGTMFTGTSTHLVWSVDVGDWRRIDELQAGEKLDTLAGVVAVQSIENAAIISDVYNIEVECEHVYRLLGEGVLVHNAQYSQELLKKVYGSLTQVMGFFPPRNYRCDLAADAAKAAAKALGVSGEVITIRFPNARNGLIVSDLRQELGAISDTFYHMGTMVDGRVFCPVHPKGLPYQEWINDFVGHGNRVIAPPEVF